MKHKVYNEKFERLYLTYFMVLLRVFKKRQNLNFYYFPKFFYEEKGKDLLLNVYLYNKVKLFK
ncbi:unnamed protein product [marine sediment metagenome]|uniref:Uncharacterized protein n=1 Tax=marine sediment metagenome TaxID=412755 RepID=X1T718_9ZZZZ